MHKTVLFQVSLLLLSLTLTAFAQLDERLVGRWKSSRGTVIDINHPKVGDGSRTKLTINSSTYLDGSVEYGDMDSLILTYTTPHGTVMKAYYNPETKKISVYRGDEEYATWTKR